MAAPPLVPSLRDHPSAGARPSCPPLPGLPPWKAGKRSGLLPETLTWARLPARPDRWLALAWLMGVDLQSIHANPGVEDLGEGRKDLIKGAARG